eukprot:m.367099 g.367099  ORF g.367099 m.367099 type:complete len:78 (+) comp56072_c0_seq11:1366-1599(+)
MLRILICSMLISSFVGEAELENFLRILDAEQQEHIKQIAKRYELRKQRLTEAIAECTNTSADSVTSGLDCRASLLLS